MIVGTMITMVDETNKIVYAATKHVEEIVFEPEK